ncbi:MAG TPA: hypothetical protein DC001_07355 [Clostridiales bacterium]|nr:hypothetical protein [Clostridiales bacterium]
MSNARHQAQTPGTGSQSGGTFRRRKRVIYIGIAIAAAAALLLAYFLLAGRQGGGEEPDAAAVQALLLENEAVWLRDTTAGICLLDLDFDGVPELFTTDTQIVWYDELGAYYFGDSEVSVYSLKDGRVKSLGGYVTDEYCFLAAVHLHTDSSGKQGWYYTSQGEVWMLSLENGVLNSAAALVMPDISGGDTATKLIRNESWVSSFGDTPDADLVARDVEAITAEYFAAR